MKTILDQIDQYQTALNQYKAYLNNLDTQWRDLATTISQCSYKQRGLDEQMVATGKEIQRLELELSAKLWALKFATEKAI